MERLGQYKIIRKLGAGAMGEVYLAEHARMGVPYAVKVLPEAMAADREARERFVSEARVMATLRHPNIVQVHNMDVDGDVHYIVMDFVSPDGRNPKTLDDLLRERGGRLPENEVWVILEQVCEALIHSHSQGVIHCDIKPSNILLDRNNVVRVSDFGLAKIVGSAFLQQSIAMSLSGSLGAGRTIAPHGGNKSPDDSLGAGNTLGAKGSSRAESLVGTFHYMPPEVQTGGAWTEQGDIYSVGVLAYVLLTGQMPLGRWELPSQLQQDIPVSWDSLVDCALKTRASDRFSSVQMLREALRVPAGQAAPAVRVRTQRTSRTEVPDSVVNLARDFVEEHHAKWNQQQFLEFVVSVYENPAHVGLSKESVGAALESEKNAWLEEDARRKAEEARLAEERRQAAEEAERRHKEADKARRKVEEARKAEEEKRRQETAAQERQKEMLTSQRNKSTRPILLALVILAVAVVGGGFLLNRTHTVPALTAEEAHTLQKELAPDGQIEQTFAGIEMLWIPPGEFTMGSPENEEERDDDESPQHRVTLSQGFWLGKYEVTQTQWQSVMGNNPSGFTGDGRLPVEQVSWNDCQEFIKKLNAKGEGTFRLPTEAEWEYACRAGSTTAYFFGGNEVQLGDYAWYNENSDSKTHPVGQKRPNAWGLYDMHGNVWEWCQDWYSDYSSGAVTDPTGPGSGEYRLLRGGSWNRNDSGCRSAARTFRYYPAFRYLNLGFRISRTP